MNKQMNIDQARHLPQAANIKRRVRFASLIATVLIVSGCASTSMVPFTVQSDPLGAHVLYQVQTAISGNTSSNDWIYLGLTPLDIRREIGQSQLRKADAFVLRVVKDGYLDQQKSWTGKELSEQLGEKGRVFWNPRLVPSTQ
ncbi:MAG: hypothetical protein DHS20C01_20420 [marine bacterium B5-7]|nr:MAG: hypothetical protein DHS20C01_20420 [marine bacterium B5-7]